MTKKNALKLTFFSVIISIAVYLLYPLPASLQMDRGDKSIQILDKNDQLLYEKRENNFGSHNYLRFEKIPKNIIDSIIAIEDKDFYKHIGINPKSILRAMWQNISANKIISGGSTITQQLVRNKIKPKKRNYFYKAKEAILAIKLETRLSKKEILEAYLNTIYFGHQAYGIQSASQIFFEKNITELSKAESAFLVGLIQSPSNFDPYKHFKKAKSRQERVIDELDISEKEKKSLKEEKINIASGKINIKAPHFVMWILKKTKNMKIKKIHTTLDLNLQTEIEEIVRKEIENLKDKNVSSASVVVLDAKNGDLLAMIGSADYFDSNIDGSVNIAVSNRQPGSALKPFTYTLALKRGDTTATTIADIETQFFTQEGNPYIPRNYDYGYHGLVRYREALANSYNIPAIKVLEKVGVENLMNFLKKCGISTFNKNPEYYGLALTLGDAEIKLLELTQAYGMLARGGKTLKLRYLNDAKIEKGDRVINEKIAWLITDILDDDIARLPEFGEKGPLEFDFPVAAKTGTTRNSRDNWTFGYTKNRIVGVWVGNANNDPMRGTSGVTGAGPIFHKTMLAAMKNLPKTPFKHPEEIIQKEICRLSGKIPTQYCPHKIIEYFIEGREPKEKDDIYQAIELDKRNGLLSNENCPKEFIEEKIFAIFPTELKTWARENGWKMPPRKYSPLCKKNEKKGEKWLKIEKPNTGETYLLDSMIPNKNEKIIFSASASDNINLIDWYVDNKLIGKSHSPVFRMEWEAKNGTHKITAKNGTQKDTVIIKIEENKGNL